MILTEAQNAALCHLRAAYVGPEGGPDELIVNGRPNLQYTVGMLYPPESAPPQSGGQPPSDGPAGEPTADVPEGEVEEADAAIPLTEEWRPSSVAISFVTDGRSVLCDFAAGTYTRVDDDGPPSWRRTPFVENNIELSGATPPRPLDVSGVAVQIGSRWRPFGSAWLVTVHARVMTAGPGDAATDPSSSCGSR